MFSKLMSIEKKYAWGFFGVMLGIIALVYTLLGYYKQDKMDLTYEIASVTNVLDLHEPINDLNILFKGVDIEKNNQNLQVFNVNIKNTGQLDIKQDDFDKNDIWGLSTKDGKIVEVRLIGSNSDYITTHIGVKRINDNTVEFNKVIFEKDKYFTIELLVLHNKDRLPEIDPVGKIAGIDNITIVKSWIEKEKPTFFQEVIFGSVFVHLVRALIYLIILGILVVIVAILAIVVSEINDSRKRKRRRKKFASIPIRSNIDPLYVKFLEKIYINIGKDALKRISELLNTQSILVEHLEKYEHSNRLKNKHNLTFGDMERFEFERIILRNDSYVYLDELIDLGIVEREGDIVRVEAGFMEVLKSVLVFLNK